MSVQNFLPIINAEAVSYSKVQEIPFSRFRSEIISATKNGWRLSAFFGMKSGQEFSADQKRLVIIVVLANDSKRQLLVGRSSVGESFPSLTPECPQAHMFERELAETWGVVPDGHPTHHVSNTLSNAYPASKVLKNPLDFFHIDGDAIHQVGVGPVHAGVIEPGHFRFQCHGEKVLHLEIALAYQHRGIERALVGGPYKHTLKQIETVAGDSTVGHAWAYAQALESLLNIKTTSRVDAIRAIGLELERMANHCGDIGALGGDVGFLPTSAYCGRIRGDFLNMSALLCGSRLGRCLIRVGGCGFDLDSPPQVTKLMSALDRAYYETKRASDLLWNSVTVMSRFENTGVLPKSTCRDFGIVGPAARASGLMGDIRIDFPFGHYKNTKIRTISSPERITQDVAARAFVRYAEIENSYFYLKELLNNLPNDSIQSMPSSVSSLPLLPDALVVSLVEGHRGEICHVVITDERRRFLTYKIVDPSFHNWMGLAIAMRNQEISDFPLCNKSFNLSYCGADL